MSLLDDPALTIAPELSGFIPLPSEGNPFITLDSQRRFYLNASLRKLFGIKAYDRVSLMYRQDTKELALLTKNARFNMSTASYVVDGRHYMSARKFCAEQGYEPAAGKPYTFEYDRGASVGGVFIFRLASK